MSSPNWRVFRGFNTKETKMILEALSFAKSKIEEYRAEKKAVVNKAHHIVINEDVENEVKTIEAVESFLNQDRSFRHWMHAENYEVIVNTIRSALDIYLQDTLKAKARSGLDAFDRKIEAIREIITSPILKDVNTDLYDKYYVTSSTTPKGKKVEVFFSYSHKDRALARKIATLLSDKGIDVFLAHEHIEISEEWREKIFKRLKSSNVLLALLTPNYEKSVWANQEAGFMYAKGRVIPLIIDKKDIKKFGLLEALQGIPIEKRNVDKRLEDILRSIFR